MCWRARTGAAALRAHRSTATAGLRSGSDRMWYTALVSWRSSDRAAGVCSPSCDVCTRSQVCSACECTRRRMVGHATQRTCASRSPCTQRSSYGRYHSSSIAMSRYQTGSCKHSCQQRLQQRAFRRSIAYFLSHCPCIVCLHLLFVCNLVKTRAHSIHGVAASIRTDTLGGTMHPLHVAEAQSEPIPLCQCIPSTDVATQAQLTNAPRL